MDRTAGQPPPSTCAPGETPPNAAPVALHDLRFAAFDNADLVALAHALDQITAPTARQTDLRFAVNREIARRSRPGAA